MKLFSNKLQKRTVFVLLFALLLTAFSGAVSACAEDGDMQELEVLEVQNLEVADLLQEVDPVYLQEPDPYVWQEEPDPVDLQEPEMTDVELERVQLSQCVFTIYEGEVYWMSLTEDELLEYACYLRDALDLNIAAVSALLSNIQFESGFNPNKIGDDGAAYGICQWRGARLDQMVAYCDENGLSPISLEGQLAFLVHDLQENYIYPYDLIRLCDDTPWGASEATYNFCAYYEVPSDPDTESIGRVALNDILFYPTLLELLDED